MEYLIKKGVPMRTGHETVGKLVSQCEGSDSRLSDLTLDEFQVACDKIENDVYDVLGTRNAMAALCSYGSGGKAQVSEQLKVWQKKLGLENS